MKFEEGDTSNGRTQGSKPLNRAFGPVQSFEISYRYHTDPETVSGWTLTTIKANGCLRTFSVVWKSSLINQNLLWRHFWIKLFTSFWVKIWQNMSSTVSHKCPQSRFWFTRELFDTTLKVLRQPLAWVVVKVQPEACSGSVCIVHSPPPPKKKCKAPVRRRARALPVLRRASALPVRRRARALPVQSSGELP